MINDFYYKIEIESYATHIIFTDDDLRKDYLVNYCKNKNFPCKVSLVYTYDGCF